MIRAFLDTCNHWLCDGYYRDVRYLAVGGNDEPELLEGAIVLAPLPPPQNDAFNIEVDGFVAGQALDGPVSKTTLLSFLEAAVVGAVDAGSKHLTLRSNGQLASQMTPATRNTWFSPLVLQLIGAEPDRTVHERLAALDDRLRTNSPPFDGLTDLARWLSVPTPAFGRLCTLTTTVLPPIDLIFDKSTLSDDRLRLLFEAHAKLDASKVNVAVNSLPAKGLRTRSQIAGEIEWGGVSNDRRCGEIAIECPQASSALVMLMLDNKTVRRHWFVDRSRSRNQRLVAVQQFDGDLERIRWGLFDADESAKFEMAIAALFFLFGFAPAIQLETDAPDLVVATPGGRLAVVECTTRTSDVATKVGKLVDRRGALAKGLQAGGHLPNVTAALVCRLPRDQIAAQAELLKRSRVILIAREELDEALQRALVEQNPDELLETAVRELGTESADLSGG